MTTTDHDASPRQKKNGLNREWRQFKLFSFITGDLTSKNMWLCGFPFSE